MRLSRRLGAQKVRARSLSGLEFIRARCNGSVALSIAPPQAQPPREALGERDLLAVAFAGLLVAFAVTVAFNYIADHVRNRRVGRP